MDLPEEAGVLARRNRAVRDDVRIGDERGEFAADRREPVHHRPVGGPQIERVAQPDVIQRRGVAGERVVARRIVVLHRVRHRAHESHLVHDLRQVRQPLADLNAIGAGGNGLVRAADLFRGVGLHVKHVDMAWAAELVEEDDGLRPGFAAGGFAGLFRRLRAQQAGQRESQHPESADLEQVPARKARGAVSGAGEVHGLSKWTKRTGSKFKVQGSRFRVPGSGLKARYSSCAAMTKRSQLQSPNFEP